MSIGLKSNPLRPLAYRIRGWWVRRSLFEQFAIASSVVLTLSVVAVGGWVGARIADGADPKSARSHRDLGLALLRAGRPREAIVALESAQRMEETQDGFRYLAEAFTALGDRDASSRQLLLYRRAVEQAKRERIRELAGGG